MGRARGGGVGGVEDGGEEVVFDVEGAGARFGGALVRGDDGGDTLADEADGVVEQAGVVGVGAGVFVAGGGEQAGGSVLVSEDGDDAGVGEGGGAVDAADAGVGVGGAQQAHVEEAGGRASVA